MPVQYFFYIYNSKPTLQMLLNVSLETRNQISIPIMIHLEPPSLDVLPPTIIEELQISKNLIQSFSIVAFHGFVHEIMILISLYYEIYFGRIFLQLLIKTRWPECIFKTRIREPLVSSNHFQSKAIQKMNHQRINNTL
jgi:hypothetical protein